MKLVVGNQKAYLNREGVLDFIEKTKEYDCSNVVICPTTLYIDYYIEKSKYVVGSQDVSEKEMGARTGEVCAEQLSSMGVVYSIVGHSERRKENMETSEMFFNKIKRLLELDLKPIFCIGETQEERESGLTKDIVGKQIIDVFDRLDKTEIEKIIIAYEPVWAIGTGLVPTNDDITDMVNYIKDFIQDRYSVRVLVLYGGSVSKNNIDILNQIETVDGYLIGGASTKPEEFLYIMKVCNIE